MAAPFYIVFAGVNGAGKSTFFRSGLWHTSDMPSRMARVNPDELLRENGGDWRDPAASRAAGKASLEKIGALLAKGRSFNQETTFSGRLALRNVERAQSLGYRVLVYYIGVESPELAIGRVRHRVELGGHDIDADSVRRRYRSSLANFARVLDCCEQAVVFDNTDDFSCLAIWLHGSLAWWGGPGKGDWLANAMADDTLWKRG